MCVRWIEKFAFRLYFRSYVALAVGHRLYERVSQSYGQHESASK